MNYSRFSFLFLTSFFIISIVFAENKAVGFYRSKGLYNQGAKHCLSLLANAKNKEERKELLMELAACYQFNTRDHTYHEAAETYRKFISEFPDDPLCSKAYFNIGRCYDAFTLERENDIEKARGAYKECYEKYPESQWADQAFFWNANSHIFNLNPETAKISAQIFEDFLDRYPDSFLTGVVHSQLSELYCAWLNNYEAAVRHSKAALNCGIQDVNLRSLHLYRLGYLYQFKLKDETKALQWYKKLISESPAKSDPNYFVAQKRVRELISKSETDR